MTTAGFLARNDGLGCLKIEIAKRLLYQRFALSALLSSSDQEPGIVLQRTLISGVGVSLATIAGIVMMRWLGPCVAILARER